MRNPTDFAPGVPTRVYSETDVLKDSQVWEYLQFLQMNRINTIKSGIWDDPGNARFKILNLIVTIDQLEFLVWDKVKYNEDAKTKYNLAKPIEFRSLSENTKEIEKMINGDPFTQLRLVAKITKWLMALDSFLSGMKKIRRTAFIAGKGALDEESA